MQDIILLVFIFVIGLFVGWFVAAFLLSSKTKGEINRLKEDLIEEKRRSLLLEEMLKNSKEQFRGISFEVIKETNDSFMKLATTTFEKFFEKNVNEYEKKNASELKPIKESLEKFNKEVQELEKSRLTAYVSLKEQLTSLIEANKELKTEAHSLASALRTPHIRGRWGEIQLKRIVELSGMVAHCDFVEQKSENTETGRIRPDLIVHLPGNRKIVVDAKAPLSAYLEAYETQNEELKRNKLKEHARQLRSHIITLSKRGYADEIQPAPEFVILFLPGDLFFSAAMEQDPTLIEAGIESHVVLATPTTLIALLKSVAYGWRQEGLNKNAEEIVDLGKELYKRLSDMAGHFAKVGKCLDASVEAYNKTLGTLESRLLVTARRFKDLQSTSEEGEMDNLEQIEKRPKELQSIELIKP